MTGDLLDVVLIAATLLFALSGYRQGLVVGVLSFVGFLGGGLLGMQVAPAIAQKVASGLTQPLVGLLVVFLCASIGQLLATTVGGAVRRRLTWRPVRVVDSAGGAAVSVLAVLLISWLVGTAVATSPFQELSRQVRHSRVLTSVDAIMPIQARTWFSSFRRLIDRHGFPEIFGGIGPRPVTPVSPPDPAVLNSRAVQVARQDIVKVVGTARSCSREVEGTAFVYAANHVVTNAHVVAGVTDPTVDSGGRPLRARVVLYDPDIDIAVLYVPGLDRAPLIFTAPAPPNAGAVVAGYPGGGPFTAVAARVRDTERVRGPNIYQTRTVLREVYAIRAVVRPGNSGGPLLTPDGAVYGVVFAAAADNSDTGYALTAAEVARDTRAAAAATAAVDTGGCD